MHEIFDHGWKKFLTDGIIRGFLIANVDRIQKKLNQF